MIAPGGRILNCHLYDAHAPTSFAIQTLDVQTGGKLYVQLAWCSEARFTRPAGHDCSTPAESQRRCPSI